jgi:Tetratricopeptide repeat
MTGFRTGKILYALGNVLESQERYAESLDFHTRCLQQYMVTLGNNHFRTADICHRLAGHFMRTHQYDEAQYVVFNY